MTKLDSLLDFAKAHVPFHHARAPDGHRNLDAWPLMTMDDLAALPLHSHSELLADSGLAPGYIVASGGTTGKPKYLHYTWEEVDAQSANIAKNFAANGLSPGDRAVNYFTSGDMWSSFLLVDKALARLPVTVFPLGRSPNLAFALQILDRFEPNAIAGIPSMLLDLARFCADSGQKVRMQKVFYAGEPMTAAMRKLLGSIWDSDLIRSAGYASTDVGTIGWQCVHCEPDEHFAFDDAVVEIVDDEIVVTSLSRRAMPIIRYRTGDRAQWRQPSCTCGNGAPMFKLKGRLDSNVIIWGCWISYEEVAAALRDMQIDYVALQLRARASGEEQYLEVTFETADAFDRGRFAALRDSIYGVCGDLNTTVPRDFVESHLSIEAAALGALRRNDRTGKVIPIIDERS